MSSDTIDYEAPTVVLDWDGTVTMRDTLWIVLERFGDRGVFERAEDAIQDGKITYRELMEMEFRTVHGALDEVVEHLVQTVRIRPGFHELLAEHDPLILSSGFEQLIRPILAREGVRARLVANAVDAGDDGWTIRWRDRAACKVCGDWCKRTGLPPGPLVYVGDGYSDRCPALAADRIFARGDLADYLRRHRVRYEQFDDLHQVLGALGR